MSLSEKGGYDGGEGDTGEGGPPADLIAAASALRTATHVVALTGAGASKESGLPTFREAQTGLWARYRPEELATPEAFAARPDIVLEWYAWRRRLALGAEPNAGHRALVELAGRAPRLTLVTQNVDGLHQRAGSRDVVELHGTLHEARCSTHETVRRPWPASDASVSCDVCGGLLRPAVVWFGEPLPADALRRAASAAIECDVFLSIGTSGLVHPAASLGRLALEAGATVVVINPVPDIGLTGEAVIAIAARAAEALPTIVRQAWSEANASDATVARVSSER